MALSFRKSLPIRSIALLILLPAAAVGYEQSLHSLLVGYAFDERSGWLREKVDPVPRGGADSFREWMYEQVEALPDDALVERFKRRFPTVGTFDRWAFKEFLGLNPEAECWGVDRVHDSAIRRGDLLAESVRHPAQDGRNRDRFAHDTNRRVLHDGSGGPLPEDPATVYGWGISGEESGFAARYALPSDLEMSDSRQVLTSEPWRYADPAHTRTFSAERAQTYTDLSILAAAWDGAGAEYLSLLWGGHAQHHIINSADQLNTIHFGIPEFMDMAGRQALAENATTLGGTIGERLGEEALARRIAVNHRRFASRLWASRAQREEEVRRAGGRPRDSRVVAALDALSVDDAEMARVATESDFFGAELVAALAARGSREAPELLRAVSAASVKDIRRGSFSFEIEAGAGGADDPEDFVAGGESVDEALGQFADLNARGMQRAGTAMRTWLDRRDSVITAMGPVEPEPEPQPVRRWGRQAVPEEEMEPAEPTPRELAVQLYLTRLVNARLDEMDGAEVRRAAWIPLEDHELPVRWIYPVSLVLVVLLVAGAYWGNAVFGSQQRRSRRELRF